LEKSVSIFWGSDAIMPTGKKNTIEKFWSLVPVDDPDKSICTIWRGNFDSDGYADFPNSLEMSRRVARAIWEMKYGPIPKGMYICHTCDNPSCIRLSHLFLDTPKSNMKDMAIKGRGYTREKGHCKRHKLTEADILMIREFAENFPNKIIADAFKVSTSHIRDILRGKYWGHI
jgi:hypothetical protein